ASTRMAPPICKVACTMRGAMVLGTRWRKKRNACGDVRNRVEGTLSRTTKEYSIMFSRVVRSVGPNWYQVVLDIHAVPAYNS
ncbi:MAG: hypothetical protein QXI32_03015, partial [Candidatus Bathyarchaeia archaeon]